MRGVHAHVGSQILQAEPLAAAVAPSPRSGRSTSTISAAGSAPATPGRTNLPRLRTTSTCSSRQRASTYRPMRRSSSNRDAVWSPHSAATIYRVITIKRGQTTFVAVDGGMGDNLEVALFDQRFEAGIANRLDASDGEVVTVVGRHCESGDILVDGVSLNAPRVDDLLVVPATGAYCYTMSNNYNGNRRIPVVFVAYGTPSLVVRRETWDDLAARDVS